MSGATATHDLEPGTLLDGRYEVAGKLGEGGFGTVYEARDLVDTSRVAVKVVSPDEGSTFSESLRRRLEREINALQSLSCVHTVSFRGHGVTATDAPYLVFEYLEGSDLADVLHEQGSLDLQTAGRILRQVLLSLDEAHRAGLIHRDLKPQNIRVLKRDPVFVKLLDFGIARAFDGSQKNNSVTKTGELIGTPRYMSPEQLTERPLGPASDIYSLGMVALEMIAGPAALAGNQFLDQLERLQTGYLFAAAGTEGAPRLHAVIRRMTARDAADRPQSAREVLAMLDGPADVSSVVRATDRDATSRVGTVIGFVVVCVLTFALVAAVLLGQRKSAPRTTVLAAPNPPATKRTVPRSEPARVDVVDQDGGGFGLEEHCPEPPHRGRGFLGYDGALGGERWLTYVPSSGDGPFPLMILLHAKHESSEALATVVQAPRLSEEHGIVIVAPGDEGWSVLGDPWSKPEHPSQIHAVFQQTALQVCIDPGRVWIVGHGSGGLAANKLVCEDWVGGVVIHGFRYHQPQRLCHVDAKARAPVLVFNPMDSPRFPNDGTKNCNGAYKPTPENAEKSWTELLGCRGDATTGVQNTTTECKTWGCDAPLQICHVRGGTPWSGSPATLVQHCDGRPPSFDLTTHMIDWLQSLAATD